MGKKENLGYATDERIDVDDAEQVRRDYDAEEVEEQRGGMLTRGVQRKLSFR